MEELFQYFLKVNGLLVVFYLAYYLLLRKETFFQSNRWFLLLGIGSAFLFPFISFTNIVWIDPQPILNYATTTITSNTNYDPVITATPIDWNQLLFLGYCVICSLLFMRLGIELYSFFRIVKTGNKKRIKDIQLVETQENHNPFSFFNYLVCNTQQFTEEELEYILTHERVHIEEKHSIDVLLIKTLCLLFWINPMVWLYRKAILQNLEFIADYKTTMITENKYQYQKTLLKTIINYNQLSITNQFYQSLIKKRIVMLNTNPSSKKKIWKYTLVLPFLIGFIFLFQIETIAQVKERIENSEKTSKEIEVEITKNTTDQEIKEFTNTVKQTLNIEVTIDKLKRNQENEIVAIKVSANIDKTYKPVIDINDDQGIENFTIIAILDNKEKDLKFSTKSADAAVASSAIKIEKNTTSNKSTITNYGNWKVEKYEDDEQPILFVVNGKKQSVGSNITLDKEIKVISSTELDAKEATKKYGSEAKNGAIEFVVRQKVTSDMEDDFPTPPSPPSHPYENLREAPSPPDFPDAPDLPSNLDDKKAMKKYEEKMAVFDMKMKKIEPQMQQFEKEMERYVMEMEGLNPDMKAFEKDMQKFEKEMEKFEKEMQVYQDKMVKQQRKSQEDKMEIGQDKRALKNAEREALEAKRMAMEDREEAMKDRKKAMKDRKEAMKARADRQKAAAEKN